VEVLLSLEPFVTPIKHNGGVSFQVFLDLLFVRASGIDVLQGRLGIGSRNLGSRLCVFHVSKVVFG
jgi:hypothetical protein